MVIAIRSQLSKKSTEIMVNFLEREIAHYKRPSVQDDSENWCSFVDGKISALEQTLEFVEQIYHD